MSDFPRRGDRDATRAWLDLKGFSGTFLGWDADALLGSEKTDILELVSDKETGLKLWGYLNIARLTGTLHINP
jgi:hypothetical protein